MATDEVRWTPESRSSASLFLPKHETAFQKYHLSITKDYLVFSAAHFLTYDGDICERLHGHNYRVTAEIHGPLDENHYVVDFIAVRDALKEIVDELDHRMLLPTDHPLIIVTADASSVEAVFRERRWVFPREDCVLLPISNTTTERLAQLIGKRLCTQTCCR